MTFRANQVPENCNLTVFRYLAILLSHGHPFCDLTICYLTILSSYHLLPYHSVILPSATLPFCHLTICYLTILSSYHLLPYHSVILPSATLPFYDLTICHLTMLLFCHLTISYLTICYLTMLTILSSYHSDIIILPFWAAVIIVTLDWGCRLLKTNVVKASKGRSIDVFDSVVGDQEMFLRENKQPVITD